MAHSRSGSFNQYRDPPQFDESSEEEEYSVLDDESDLPGRALTHNQKKQLAYDILRLGGLERVKYSDLVDDKEDVYGGLDPQVKKRYRNALTYWKGRGRSVYEELVSTIKLVRTPPKQNTKKQKTPSSSSKKPSVASIQKTSSTQRKSPQVHTSTVIMEYEDEYAGVFTITDSEVPNNMLAPGLQFFRLVDMRDEKNQLHNGYQVMCNGSGTLLKGEGPRCNVKTETTIEAIVPVPSSTFLSQYELMKTAFQQQGMPLPSAIVKAHASAITRYNKDMGSVYLKYLIKIQNGEILTNAVFDESSQSQLGAVDPWVGLVQGSFEFDDVTYPTFEVVALFNIARVENTVRMGDVEDKVTTGNRLVDNLTRRVRQSKMNSSPEL